MDDGIALGAKRDGVVQRSHALFGLLYGGLRLLTETEGLRVGPRVRRRLEFRRHLLARHGFQRDGLTPFALWSAADLAHVGHEVPHDRIRQQTAPRRHALRAALHDR